jgi:sporulation protein YlmC with PRC-barrel domain
MDWWLTGIDGEAGGIPSRFIRENMMANAAKVFPGAVAHTESGLSAAKAVYACAASEPTNHQPPIKTHRNTIMLNKVKILKGYSIQSPDGATIGTVKDFYFDDRQWTVRYLVAHTGNWLSGRQVLVSPYALVSINHDQQDIVTDLTKKQIEKSPALDSHKPVSRQFEDDYYGYYGWPDYWSGPYTWGANPYIERDRNKWGQFIPGAKAWDRHLRSTHAVSGYHIAALDGDVGHVEDFLVDDETWTIRYLIISTANWWPGKKVLVSPLWIERVSWPESKVFINLSRQTIKESPEYTDESLVTRDYEIGLHGHYNRKGYWVDELVNS